MAKSKDELIYDIENELVDPTTNKVTGERVKARLLDMVETMAESAGSGGGQLEYWKVPDGTTTNDDTLGMLLMCSRVAKIIMTSGTYSVVNIASPAMAASMPKVPTAIGLDRNMQLVINSEEATVEEFFTMLGIDIISAGYTQITEEDFYSI